jgi:predicted Na+-dependent transporter
MACTPKTISSNVLVIINAMGNEYSVFLNTVLGNVGGIFVSPALDFYFMKNPALNSLSNMNSTGGIQIDYGGVMENLGLALPY